MVRGRYGRFDARLDIFTTAMHSGGLGALLALSGTSWYPLYAQRAAGVADPLIDQQLGGVIMGVPSSVASMLPGLTLFAACLGESDRQRQRGWS